MKLVTQLGLAKRSDFVKRGLISHAAAERLRRMAKVAELARPYVKPKSPNAPQYVVARPRSPEILRALRAAGPSELQSSRQPWALVWTGLGSDSKGNITTAKLQGVRVRNSGELVISTAEGRRVILSFTGTSWLKSPKKYENRARRAAREMRLRDVAVHFRVNEYSTRIGYRLEDLDFQVARWQSQYTHPTQPNGQLHRDDMRRWFQGFELVELDPQPKEKSRGPKKSAPRPKSRRVATRSRKKNRRKARRPRQ